MIDFSFFHIYTLPSLSLALIISWEGGGVVATGDVTTTEAATIPPTDAFVRKLEFKGTSGN